MKNIKAEIARHESSYNELRALCDAAAKNRDQSPAANAVWRDACAALHDFESPVTKMLRDIGKMDLQRNKTARQFAFTFLDQDPRYFRSGYEKESLLGLIKRLDMSKGEQSLVRRMILKQIQNGAPREFRKFCQLIPAVQTDDFVADLKAAAASSDASVAFRASMALGYLKKERSVSA